MPQSATRSRPSVDLVECYQKRVREKALVFDQAQLNVVQHLQVLVETLQQQENQRKRWLGFGRSNKVNHLYIYGGVGQGKSMLMDLFFQACPVTEKKRVHFHRFMQDVHHFIHGWRQQGCVMTALAKKIRQNNRLLCFDEFHVTDIADAMIMERLFRRLFDQGVCIVMTSNRHPEKLYQGGLLREQFLSFVALLMENVEVVKLSGKKDYRRQGEKADQFQWIQATTQQDWSQLHQIYEQLTGGQPEKDNFLQLSGRSVQIASRNGRVLLASFSQLCRQTLGVGDFLSIARQFSIVLLGDIPRLSADEFDAARRFEILVDALYENKVLLIYSSHVAPTEIYTEGEGVFEFQRTVSRLLEMQSKKYVAKCYQREENGE